MLILGIETSCDETGLALLDSEAGLLAHALHSQVDMHVAYGGVVPELASRDHIRRVLPLLDSVLAEAGRSLVDVDAIDEMKDRIASSAVDVELVRIEFERFQSSMGDAMD